MSSSRMYRGLPPRRSSCPPLLLQTQPLSDMAGGGTQTVYDGFVGQQRDSPQSLDTCSRLRSSSGGATPLTTRAHTRFLLLPARPRSREGQGSGEPGSSSSSQAVLSPYSQC
ncbi:hypothetical protein TREES_T100008306 [Tupaia chinensis]|uniref:Uncharacterized protein n=1 Tax=Tupaia chinensis TaxID=246437 RepID=L9LBC9_TUPCH|nr:hypothetical protein TREES_T100008306 [Tupaia chinensis]